MRIETDYWAKPIPDRRFDWSATTSDYEPGQPIGHGRTEAEAVADLMAQLDACRPSTHGLLCVIDILNL